jgi:hypothetical protein
MISFNRPPVLLLALATALVSSELTTIAVAADDRMEWQFSEFNDPDNKGRLTARLTFGVPETDAIQVAGICDGTPSTSARFSGVTFGADTGNLKEGADVDLRFSGSGFDHVMRGSVHGTQAEVGISGVRLEIEHNDPLWDAMLEKESLDYLVPGYRANALDLARGKDKIKAFVDACRNYAEAILGDFKDDPGSQGATQSGGVTEKEAFDSAKELGTIEAWEAFLSNYPSGFRADLARAYVKKLAGNSAAANSGVTGLNVTYVQYAAGAFIKNGPKTWVEQKYAGGDALRFDETFRSEQEVKLFDASRKVHISLNIAGRAIWYALDGSPLTKLYDIVDTRGGVASPPSAPAGQIAAAPDKPAQSATDNSCRQLRKIRSKNSNTPTKITFVNRSGMYRSILWLDFKGQPKTYANLNSGEQVTLDTYMTHPWMITDGPGNCIQIVMPSRGSKVVNLGSAKSAAPPKKQKTSKKKKKKRKGCRAGYVSIEGKCIRKRDAASYCGPGYRVQGNKCVRGYKKPKPQKQRPTWQIEAIKKGCTPGLAWNPQEGCHEND